MSTVQQDNPKSTNSGKPGDHRSQTGSQKPLLFFILLFLFAFLAYKLSLILQIHFKTPALIALAESLLSLPLALLLAAMYRLIRGFEDRLEIQNHSQDIEKNRRAGKLFWLRMKLLRDQAIFASRESRQSFWLLLKAAWPAALLLLLFDGARAGSEFSRFIHSAKDLAAAASMVAALYLSSFFVLLYFASFLLSLNGAPDKALKHWRHELFASLRRQRDPQVPAQWLALVLSLVAFIGLAWPALIFVHKHGFSYHDIAIKSSILLSLLCIFVLAFDRASQLLLLRFSQKYLLRALLRGRRLASLALLFGLILAVLAIIFERQIFKELDGWLIYSQAIAAMLFIAAALHASRKTAHKTDKTKTSHVKITVTLSALVVTAVLVSGFYFSPQNRQALAWLDLRGRNTAFFLHLWQKASDFDGDGFSSILGGQDCAAWNTYIYPGAVEFVDNGIDEDCDGQDLTQSKNIAAPKALRHPYTLAKNKHARPLNFLLLSIDALRRDALGLYGAGSGHSPNMDAFAQNAQVFTQAFSAASWTMPSLASLFTGRFASEIPGYYGEVHMRKVPARAALFTDPFRRAGYQTTALSGGLKLNEMGLDRAFEHWISLGTDWKKKYAEQQVQRLLQLIDERDKDKPFLIWSHFIDIHDPYSAPKRYDKFGHDGRARYAAALLHVDDLFEAVFAKLKNSGLDKNTVVVIFADHDEAFGEHGFYTHGHSVYSEELGIPLIFKVPGLKAARLTTPVSLLDLGPTLWDLAGLDPPKREQVRRGESLAAALVDGEPAMPRQAVIAEQTVRTREFAYIKAPYYLRHDQSRGLVELFDLQHDPLQKNNLIEQNPVVAKKLDAALSQRLQSVRYIASKGLDKVLFKKLPDELRTGLASFVGGPKLAGYQLSLKKPKNLDVYLWFVPDALPSGSSYELDVRLLDARGHVLGRRKNYVTKSIYIPPRWRSFDRIRHHESLHLKRAPRPDDRLCVSFLVDNKALSLRGGGGPWTCSKVNHF